VIQTSARTLGHCIGQEVILEGWAHRVRSMGSFSFLLVRDPLGVVQTVVEDPRLLEGLVLESAIRVHGRVVAEPRSQSGAEMHVERLEVLSPAIEPPPFDLNKKELEVKLDAILDHRSLSLRHPKERAVFRIEAELVDSFRSYLRGQGFTEIFTPKIVASGTEGGANLFPIDYMGQKAFLAQSPQFYKQMMVGVFGRVFEVGHVYRAEPHYTSRHINEYLSLDLEMGFITDEQDIMRMEMGFLSYLMARLKEACAPEIALLGSRIPDPRAELPQLPLQEAKEILRSQYQKQLSEEDDLDPESERLLCQYAEEKLGSEFLFVTRYPISVRPMYAMPDPEHPGFTKSFDLLFRGMEVTTGGQRIHEYAMLTRSIQGRGLDPDTFSFYLEPFKHGMPPHGGLAIGTERLTCKLLELENIRQAALFPRDIKRITP
jgi:nondiscriminating aspartyl-tRNA synthetase